MSSVISVVSSVASRRRIDPGSLAAGVVWACGAWASLGTLALAGEGSTSRIGVLPPWWVLALLAAGALLLVAVVRPDGRDVAPLWIGGLALLPWLPMPVPPAFLILAGPLGIVLATAGPIGVGLAVAASRAHHISTGGAFDRRRARAAIGLAVAVALYCLAAWRLAPVLPGGDEPHYLIIAQSLLTDGDLRIENNHQRGDYQLYFEGELRPDYLRRGQDRQIYSIHAPGLAVLIAPAFAAGGYRAVVLLLALICAAGAALAGRAAYAVTADSGAGLFAWTGVALSAPFFFQAFTIFPDGTAAVLVMAAVWGLAQDRLPPAGPRLAVVSAALGALPWLHTRFAVLAGTLGLVYAIRVLAPPLERRRRVASRLKDLLWLAGPAVASVVCWLAFFHAIYGVADPRAPYGHATDMRLARIPHGLAGLLLDQQFGLIPNAPIYLLAIAGVPALWRLNPRLTGELTVALAPYMVAVAAHHMWWGGRSSPARFLVPVLLPAALPMAAWWAGHTTRTARRLALGLAAFSAALTAVLTLGRDGLLLYNSRDGFALWLDAAAPAVNLAYALPSLFQTDPLGAVQRALVWAALLGATWWALHAMDRRGVGGALWWTAAFALGTVAIVAGASAGWGLTGRDGLEPGSSQLTLAARACPGGGTGIHLSPLALVPPRTLLEGLEIADASRRPQARQAAFWFGRDLPPGRYRVGLSTGLSATGTLNVSLGRRQAVIGQCTFAHAAPGPTSCALHLPAGASALWLLPDAGLSRTLRAISLELIEPGAASSCGVRALRATANRAGALYVTAGRAFVERSGLWVGGSARADLVATSDTPGTSSLSLVVRNGAAPNHVTVSGEGWREQWTLAPRESRTVPVVSSNVPNVVRPVTVTSGSGFRPAETDPASRDRRLLGVWVEPQ